MPNHLKFCQCVYNCFEIENLTHMMMRMLSNIENLNNVYTCQKKN